MIRGVLASVSVGLVLALIVIGFWSLQDNNPTAANVVLIAFAIALIANFKKIIN